MQNKKLQIWLPLLLSLTLICGMYIGYKFHEKTPRSASFFNIERNTSLQEILDLIKLKYVDSVKLDSLQLKAIYETMNQLDPHSVYIPASELMAVTEDLAGNFEGIGVEFNFFADTVHVLYVLPNGPSDKAGLQIGDKIIAVDKDSIIGSTITSDDVRKKIRGEKGSTVQLAIVRDGTVKLFNISRGTIPLPALDATYLLNKETGYIRLNRFSESAYEEFMKALEELQTKKISKLVLDLRGNGGGFMNEAVDIADEFLSDNKLIVYTEGLHNKKREYRCRRPGLFEEGQLVVIVDEFSASASEVLAGALQDWDRATIIGRRTFGKGLVQEQFSLNDESALRLTVARYYTPSGRSIQRPYQNGKKEEYLDEIWNRYSNTKTLKSDSSKFIGGKIYKTLIKKRIVYGGGGIMPDISITMDTSSLESPISELFNSGSFTKFVYNYFIQHRHELKKFKTPFDFNLQFNPKAEVWNNLVLHAAKDSIYLKNISTKNITFLQKRIKAQLARYKWRTKGFYEVMNSTDSIIVKALEELKKQ